jgi:ribosomal protein S16
MANDFNTTHETRSEEKAFLSNHRYRFRKTKEIIGFYDPLKEPPEINVDLEKANYWLERGAQASKTVQSLLHKVSKSEKLSNQHS